MSLSPRRLILVPLSILLLTWATSCGETFQDLPPFPQGEDTLRLDLDEWINISPVSELLEGQPVYPFSYQIFDERYSGYLARSEKGVYVLGEGEPFEARVPFLSYSLEEGDTLVKFTERKYHLVIDRRVGKQGDRVFYILRRTRKGISDLEERQVWVISAEFGVLAICKYEIDPLSGQVTLEMTGDPEWFRDPKVISRIKYYDYTRTYYLDRDRSLLYEFNKVAGYLRVRDVKAREELYRFDFQRKSLNELVDFRIESDDRGILLVTGDSCLYFSERLELLRTTPCEGR